MGDVNPPRNSRPPGRTARIDVPSCTTSARPLPLSALTYAGARSGNGDQVAYRLAGSAGFRLAAVTQDHWRRCRTGFRPGNLIATPDGGRSDVERAEPRDTGEDRTGPVYVRSGSNRRFAAGRGDFASSWRAAGGGLDGRES